jgi:hypothetical protein
MKIGDVIGADRVIVELHVSDKKQLLQELHAGPRLRCRWISV